MRFGSVKLLRQLEQVLPAEIPKVRPMRTGDAVYIARWIEKGRRERAFREGPKLNGSSVLDYQDRTEKSGWKYHCKVIEVGDRPIGYVDYRYRNGNGEILGLFLEQEFRKKQIGRHIIRWTVANLRDQNCKNVIVRCYADNQISIRASHAAGFRNEKKRDYREGSREVRVLSLKTEPFRRLSQRELRYSLLQGENLYFHHIAIAEGLVEIIKRLPRVEVILGLGSLGRGFADQWSDIDLGILGRGTGLKRLWRGEQWLAGISVDLFLVDLDASPPEKWDDSRRQAFEESIVLFSRYSPTVRALRYSIPLNKGEIIARVRETLLKLGWLGFAPRAWYKQKKYGYTWCLPYDLWVSRGDIASAHATVDQAFDQALRLLFYANNRNTLDPKWRRYLTPGLAWLPNKFQVLTKKIEESSRDNSGFSKRAKALLSIIEKTVVRLEEIGILRENIYEAYLRTSPDYDPLS